MESLNSHLYLTIQILSDSCLCSWAGITHLALHHYGTGWDPRRCCLTRPQQPPSCLSSESSHKTQAASLPLRIRLHSHHTLLAMTYVKGISVPIPQRHLVMHERKDKESKQEYEVEAEYLWGCKGVGNRWIFRADNNVDCLIFEKWECYYTVNML